MSAPIGPGDWVECVSTDPEDADDYGRVMRVRAVKRDGVVCKKCSSEVGIDCDDGYVVPFLWCACELRPIYRPKADLIESLKAPPQRVGEPA
jgi:hypothetical protein